LVPLDVRIPAELDQVKTTTLGILRDHYQKKDEDEDWEQLSFPDLRGMLRGRIQFKGLKNDAVLNGFIKGWAADYLKRFADEEEMPEEEHWAALNLERNLLEDHLSSAVVPVAEGAAPPPPSVAADEAPKKPAARKPSAKKPGSRKKNSSLGKAPRPSEDAYPSIKWTGQSNERELKWKWKEKEGYNFKSDSRPYVDNEGNELPMDQWEPVKNCYILGPGETRGSKLSWLSYLGEAVDAKQRYRMVEKHANICFSAHPFDIRNLKGARAEIVASWFSKAGMPIRPYTKPNFQGYRTHPDNTGYLSRKEKVRISRERWCQERARFRSKGEHRKITGELYKKGEASQSAHRDFIAACKADLLFKKRGFTKMPGYHARLRALRREEPRYPLPEKFIVCGGCLRHVLDCSGMVRCEHCHVTGDQRVVATGHNCNTGWLSVVDAFRGAGAEKEDVESLADRLREFVGRSGSSVPGPQKFLEDPVFVARPGQAASGAAPAVLAEADADASTTAWTRARRQPPAHHETLPRDNAPSPDVVVVYADVETTHVIPELAEVVQIALVAPALEASFEALVMPEGDVSAGALGVHGFSKALLRRANARSFADVWPKVLSWVEACRRGTDVDVVIVGHNWLDFDGPILERLAEEASLPTLDFVVLDTLLLARRRQRRIHLHVMPF